MSKDQKVHELFAFIIRDGRDSDEDIFFSSKIFGHVESKEDGIACHLAGYLLLQGQTLECDLTHLCASSCLIF
jgi:hypothetical protein